MAKRLIHTTRQSNNVFGRVHYDPIFDEYHCRIYIFGKPLKAADYFTNEKSDAMNTISLMVFNACYGRV